MSGGTAQQVPWAFASILFYHSLSFSEIDLGRTVGKSMKMLIKIRAQDSCKQLNMANVHTANMSPWLSNLNNVHGYRK